MTSQLDRWPPFPAVLDALRSEDPEGLLVAGAPGDEYAPEAADFSRRLRDGEQVTGDVVVEVWERWFGPDSAYLRGNPPQTFDALATILDALQ